MKGWRAESLKEEELKGLLERLNSERLEAGDYERLKQVLRETKRLQRRIWWMGLAKRLLLGMLAVKNWVRRCQGKAPLVADEGCDDER